MINGILIDPSDSVVVVSEETHIGDEVSYKIGDKAVVVKSLDNIPIYHKMAIKDVAKGGVVTKYGQLIGLAGTDIKVGNHVHIHNVVEPERGNK